VGGSRRSKDEELPFFIRNSQANVVLLDGSLERPKGTEGGSAAFAARNSQVKIQRCIMAT